MSDKSSVLSYTGFRNLWAGQLISQFGDVLHFLVFLWWANEIGGPVGVGIVMSFSIGTHVVLSMYAGTIADRFDRRKILLYSDVVCAVVVAALIGVAAYTSTPPLWLLCAFAVVLKCAYVFQRPARGAAIPRLIPQERLLEANSLNAATQTAMPLAGNALGALVLGIIFKMSASLAYVFTFALNSLTFALSALFMAKLPPIEPERDKPPSSAIKEAKEGLQFILAHPVMRTMVLLFFGFEFFIAPFMPAYVVAAKTTLAEGIRLFGIDFKGVAMLSLLETGFFLGFVVGSWILYRTQMRSVGKQFSLTVFLAALTIVPMGYVTSIPLFWVLNFLCGLLMPFGVIPLETYLQKESPDAFRGRVQAAVGTLAATAAPIGIFLSGFLLEGIGLGPTFAYMGLGLGFASLAGLLSPAFRDSVISSDVPVAPVPEDEPAPEAAPA